ncbi:hypothetical protein GmHk_12G033598 [Glycine max]|nr:hypothetical protein GmHk_12G033598 [Glycine max]
MQKQEEGKEKEENPPPLLALNHVSRLCRNVKVSLDFYTKVLGFVLIERPQALDFEGAWLFNYGVGIHLVQSKQEDQNLPSDTEHLDPQDNHISFQRESGSNGEKVEGEGSEVHEKDSGGRRWIKFSSMTQMGSWWKYATARI